MKSLRVRLTVWFALGFLAVTVIFTLVTYRRLDLELRRGTFAREQNINPNWILHGSYSEEEVHEIMAALGHTTLAEAERYTREADRRRGGRRAILKLEGHTANRVAQTDVDLRGRP